MAEHPSKEELSGFLLGKLAPDTCEAVAEHIDQCPPCQQTIQSLESSSDTLAELLRKPSPVKESDHTNEVVEKIASIVTQTNHEVSVTIDNVSLAQQALSKPSPTSVPQTDERQMTSITQAKNNIPPREAFERALQASGVIDDDEWQTLLRSVPAIASAANAADLGRALVKHGALTKFQATMLYQGKSGLRMGEYIVLDRIGAGGMGQVFKARHRRMDRIVAIKVLAKSAMDSPEAIKRFQREVKAAAKLSHPNIVHAYDAGEQDGMHFLVMEFVPGRDLSQLVKDSGPLPIDKVVSYVSQAARGLAFAHSRGVVHRDIKPANLLLDEEETVKILDMGLARLDGDKSNLAANDGLTQSGQVMGTVDYMAPEQAFDTRTADAKADVYSLGCTLYRLVTGRNVYDGETLVQKLLAHREQPIPSLTSARTDIPAALDAIYTRMMAKQPEDRPTMAQLITELESLQKPTTADRIDAASAPQIATKPNQPAAEVRTVGDSGHRRPPPTKTKFLAAAAGAAAVLFLGVWLIIRGMDGKTVAEIDAPPGTKVNVPAGGSVEVATQPANPKSSTPSKTTALATPATTTTPNSFKTPVASRSPIADATPSLTQTAAYALRFHDGASVEMPSLKDGIDPAKPLTVECWVTKVYAPKGKPGVEFTGEVPVLGFNHGPPFYWVINNSGNWTAHLTTQEFVNRSEQPTGVSYTPAAPNVARNNRSIYINANGDPLIRRWHLAVVRTEKQVSFFADGKLKQSIDVPAVTLQPAKDSFLLGGATGTPARFFHGLIDEVRISQTARYEQDFKPAQQFAADADTLALYHFDEGTGDVLKDSSGNNHHGKIVGATWVRADGSAVPAVPALAKPAAGSADPSPARFTNALGMEFVLVPKGRSWLGGGGGKPGTREFTVPRDFYLGTYEVTREQWQRLMKNNPSAYKRNNPNDTRPEALAVKDITDEELKRFPVEYVSGYDCVKFINALNAATQESGWIYRLPTADEWEYACRGGPLSNPTESAFDYYYDQPTNQPDLRKMNTKGGLNRPGPVGSYPPNRLGLFDMYGNISERCDDLLPSDSAHPWVERRAIRGGDWNFITTPTATFSYGDQWRQLPYVGMRVARVPAPVPAAVVTHPETGGDYALYFDGARSLVAIPSLPTDAMEWTVEVTATIDGPPRDGTIVYERGDNRAFYIQTGPAENGKHSVQGMSRTAATISGSSLATVASGQRVRYALVRRNEEFEFYHDGRRFIQAMADPAKRPPGPRHGFTIGASEDNGLLDRLFCGTIDEIRVSKKARYDADYTPQDRLAADADTLALYHFDEGTGDVLKDSSGNNHHGKIVGATWVRADGSTVSTLPVVAKSPTSPGADWQSLFDGKTFAGWENISGKELPRDWRIENGEIVATGGMAHIATTNKFADYELEWQWQVGPGANGGLYYAWQGETTTSRTNDRLVVAPEYQLVDNIGHADGKKPENSAGSVYGMFAPQQNTALKTGEWNTSRVVVRGNDAQHWLNGTEVLRYTLGSDEWQAQRKKSPKLPVPEFVQPGPGRIALQSNTGIVRYRNLRIRSLVTKPLASSVGPDAALLFGDGTAGLSIPSLKYDGSFPLTLEAWVRPAAVGPAQKRGHVFATHWLDVDFDYDKRSWYLQSSSEKNKYFRTKLVPYVAKTGLTHVAGILDGTRLRMFIDGKLAIDEMLDAPRTAKPNAAMFFFGDGPEAGTAAFRGVMDEVRISQGVRYATDFTPQTRWEPDVQTLALYHFDETSGAFVADASPHARHRWAEAKKYGPRPLRCRTDGTLIPPQADGEGALEFDGMSSYVETADVPLDFAKPFTLEAWVWPTTQRGGSLAYVRRGAQEVQMWRGGGYDDWLSAVMIGPTAEGAGSLRAAVAEIQFDRPQHVAVVYDPAARASRMYFNGVLRRNTFPTYPPVQSTRDLLVIGCKPEATNNTFIQGRLYEFRLSQAARYTADFTPSTVPFEPDDATLVLYHCDDIGPGETLHDSSGRNRHGKLVNVRRERVVTLDEALRRPPPPSAASYTLADPAFQQWLVATQALPAEQQLAVFSKKLIELNPGFDGKLVGGYGYATPVITNGVVTGVGFDLAQIADISPVRVFTGLTDLYCVANHRPNGFGPAGILVDLSPLAGMPLTSLYVGNVPVIDLSPLRGMPLKSLGIYVTQVADLSPLVGMPLEELGMNYTRKVTSIEPLRGMPLKQLSMNGLPISDLSPLAGMKLDKLAVSSTPVADLSVLRGMPLRGFVDLSNTKVTDLSPLHDCPTLNEVDLNRVNIAPVEISKLLQAVPECKVKFNTPGDLSTVTEALQEVDPERRVARWVLARGGKVDVLRAGDERARGITADKDLPAEPFWVMWVQVPSSSSEISAAEWQSLGELRLVRGIDVSGCRPTNEALAAIGRCRSLDSLIMASHPSFNDEGLQHLVDLPHLRSLDIGVGGHTAACLESLGKLKSLRVLKMGTKDLQVKSLKPLQSLGNLLQLDLNGATLSNQAVGDLAALPQLRRLNLAGSGLTPAVIDELLKLRGLYAVSIEGLRYPAATLLKLADHPTLSLINTYGSGIKPEEYEQLAKSLPRLTFLHPELQTLNAAELAALDWAATVCAPFNGYDAQLREKKSHNAELWLTINKAFPPADFRQLAKVKNVTGLVLNNHTSSDEHLRVLFESLRDFPHLQSLTILNPQFASPVALADLPRHTGLQSFSIGNNSVVQDESLAALSQLPHSSHVKLDASLLTDGVCEHLKPLKELEVLSVMGATKFTGSRLSELRDKSRLWNLQFTKTGVTDAALAALVELPALEELWLQKTAITDAGLQHLAGCQNLRLVSVAGTKVTPAGIASLRKALPNCLVLSDLPTKTE